MEFHEKILRVTPWKFDENFITSECDENCAIEVLGHDEHEYTSSFIINTCLYTC